MLPIHADVEFPADIANCVVFDGHEMRMRGAFGGVPVIIGVEHRGATVLTAPSFALFGKVTS